MFSVAKKKLSANLRLVAHLSSIAKAKEEAKIPRVSYLGLANRDPIFLTSHSRLWAYVLRLMSETNPCFMSADNASGIGNIVAWWMSRRRLQILVA